jgi:hypothetical protein
MDLDSSTPAGTRVNIIVLAFTLVSGLIVFLRLFTRLVISKGAGLEDACIVFAMVSRLGLLSMHFPLTNFRVFPSHSLC